MYSLFEIRKILSVSNPALKNGVKIIDTAYAENADFNILALICSNGYLLFRHVNVKLDAPIIRQLCWFNDPDKQVKAMCFDSSGLWLLLVTKDATLFILPVSMVVETVAEISPCWKTDALTEIKLSGQRALTTSVQWWKTNSSEHIAVIGSELGEISFINLTNKKEVGGTYIMCGISSLDILYDESHHTTYLLITGTNQQQWRLLLEEKKANFYWPFTSDNELAGNSNNGIQLAEKMPLTEEKIADQRPHRLSKFESGTFLTPQCGDGINLVSAYNSSSALLQVLEGDLDQMHLFSYRVPADCKNIILSNRLIFVTSKNDHHVFKILSRKFAELSAENLKKKEPPEAEIQKFVFNDAIFATYKVDIQFVKEKLETKDLDVISCLFTSAKLTEKDSPNRPLISNEPKRSHSVNESISTSLDSLIGERRKLEGCILVQNDCVWECKPKISAEALFLTLTAIPSNLPQAEKLGVMLGLDLQKLYDVAADSQLYCGKFAQAVHLYQLSKCPQLKRVAHFMGYGFLSELIAYIQVLFSTKGVEIVSADKCHFANIALHCFGHQVKSKVHDKSAICAAFKKFLKENPYYDEEVAAKLLAEQGLYALLHYFAKVRSQQGLVFETLLSMDGIKNSIDAFTFDSLVSSGYDMIFHQHNNEHYMKFITSYQLLQFLAAKPLLLNLHLQHLITLLPRMNVELLRRIAYLYDPCHEIAKLSFRNLASSNLHRKYCSLSSLSSELNYKEEELSSVEDVFKFFIFVLLMLFHKMGYPKFCEDLISNDLSQVSSRSLRSCSATINEHIHSKQTIVACGQAHVAYIQNGVLYTWGKSSNGRLGSEDVEAEYQSPQPVLTFLRFQVTVLSVSCGALHTMALTDFGVFAWGSSRFGQLGLGDVQQATQPRIIESILKESIITVCCGQYHSLALTKDGKVLSWGWGIHGQLGHGNADDVMIPKFIEAIKKKKILSISAGQSHSVILSQNGDIYTFGCGMFGQLGTGSVLKQTYPQLVNLPERMKLVASGYFHVLAVSRANKLYTWGCNPQTLRLQAQNSRRTRHHGTASNQTATILPGANNNCPQRSFTVQQSHLSPNLINIPSLTETVIQLCCGSHHSVIITETGKIFTWGRNSEGQIGNGTRKEQKIPGILTTMKDKTIVSAACGADFTVSVDMSNKVYGWGQNDGCQIGQKPSTETNSKYSCSSTSGRVITIRTNRRMITITQPCRQSILRPIEIVIPHNAVQKTNILDSGSFETDYSGKLYIFNSTVIENPRGINHYLYDHRTLHWALKAMHRYCDSTVLLNHCLNFGNFQAAAKLCALEHIYDKALEYQLKAFKTANENVDMDIALHIIEVYSRMIVLENKDCNKRFFNHIINFWMDNKLPVSPLEHFLHQHIHKFSFSLGLLLFKNNIQGAQKIFIESLSIKFCILIMKTFLKNGQNILNLLEEADVNFQTSESFNTTTYDDTIPQDRLWLDILHNVQSGIISQSAIQLSENDVDLLAKSLKNEKLCLQLSHNSSNRHEKDSIAFSCGHCHTISDFHNTVLPRLKNSLNFFPQTVKLMLFDYQDDVIFSACPKCITEEISAIV